MAIADPGPMTTPGPAPPRPPRRMRRGLPLAVAAALPALVHPTARLLARADWKADLLTHFQVPALAASILGAVAMGTLGKNRWAAAALAALAVSQAAAVLRYDLSGNPVAPGPGGTPRLKVLMANVLATNDDHRALLDLIRRERPDVVALVEFSARWRRAMGPLRASHPHRIEVPGGARGVALYSTRPILESPAPAVVRPLGDGNPALVATLEFGGEPTHLWILHPPSPIGGDGRGRGRAEFLELARMIARRPGPTLVVGDMNRTDGSPTFADFLRASRLRDSRLGFGRQPSWPVDLPYRIPIDHAFVSPGLAVVDRRLGPPIGSDHRPLLVELAPAGAGAGEGLGAGRARARTTSAAQRSASASSPP
ncbi:endonuclease/exonuclease/phosphatase family protein [Tautonia plasticadhaerens]|uniref:Endonuclease/Exonuclease/phosphatase family protein n=1 Tax=Tautonia plasticadhaerens TaxID=2527974 RepID=A0A518H5N0_9BACT|nr:endonuclease/exonuclease/phosphatase family protein [Tautonia plasticadhaerens]QDV36118.1 Endonuclease/Exonuclease/phosphatase family protein [Tautonia plasticadhaerens]